MNGLEEIWAKSEPVETLTQHTKKVLEIWFELKERYSEEIENEQFWNTSFNAVAYHDFGKICNLFQETIKKEKIVEFDSRVRHEFFSKHLMMKVLFNRFQKIEIKRQNLMRMS